MVLYDNGLEIAVAIVSVIITAFTILLIIIYSINKSFKSIPCYFNIFFCVIITLDDILRLIPISEGEGSGDINEANLLCRMQAITLSTLDKYLLSLITVYSAINFFSVFFVEFYQKYIKLIFISLIIIGFIISLILSIIFYNCGFRYRSIICYIDTEHKTKIILDTIYTSFLFLINIICLIGVIIHMIKLIGEYKFKSNKILERKCKNHLRRFIIDLIINLIYFITILLLIIRVLPSGTYKDLVCVLACLMVELFFTINTQLINAFIRLITCNKVDKYKENENENNEELLKEDENVDDE